MQPPCGAPEDSFCSDGSGLGTDRPPSQYTHLGLAQTPLSGGAENGRKQQRMDKTHRPSVRPLCFVNLFSNGKRLIAVVRH